MAGLVVGAVGIVFGDIGTSPLYAFRETFAGHHPLVPDELHVLGVLSLIFWSMMLVVTIKYVFIIMKADNKGEGGSLALLALINRKSEGKRWTKGIILLGVFATALFYGDSMITPAISVLSAVEGLTTVEARFAPMVLPLAVGILIGLFMIQSRGTAKVGLLFGPIMLIYFAVLAVLGVSHILGNPHVLIALNPWYAVRFFIEEGHFAFLAMGSVVLAVTGAEALYADMGHFGRKPIGVSWLFFVLPALMLNYLGQGAMLLGQDMPTAMQTIHNPFFLLAPEPMRLPLVILATMATVIASQAVISGAFSVTQQAIQLGFIPRLPHHPHLGRFDRPDLHPGDELGPDGDGHPARHLVPLVEQPCRGLWHRRDRRDGDRHLPARGRAVPPVGLEQMAGDAAHRRLRPRRSGLFRREPDQSARWRLVPAADRLHRLYPAHHMGARTPADDRSDARGRDADQGLRPVRRVIGNARGGNRRLHDIAGARRTPCAAPQSQA